MTYDVSPKKGRKVWVCRFKVRAEACCPECQKDVISAVEVSELKPIQSWADFFAPFFFIDRKCPHPGSAVFDEPTFQSFYLKEKNVET